MANYKVGDLDVTISGVSKDAVSSIGDVIEQLDALQGKLGVVGGGFKQAFKSASDAAVKTIAQNYREIARDTEVATNSQNDLNKEVEKGERTQESAAETAKTLTEQIEEYQTQIAKLSQTIAETEFGKVKSLDNIDGLSDSEKLEKYKEALQELDKIKRQSIMTSQEIALAEFEEERATAKTNLQYYRLQIANGILTDGTRDYREEVRKLVKQLDELDRKAGKISKGSFSKLIKQISKISLYRTIRRGLQLVVQAFTQTIQDFAKVDDSINDTMTQLTSSAQVIKLSFGTLLLPIIQAITPAVQELSVGFANMANTINASMAKMNNLATYTKINVKALQNYRKQLNKTSGALFDFDKFRALSSKKDDSSVFLEEAAVADLNKEVGVSVAQWTVVYDILHNIGNIIKRIIQLAIQVGDAISPWVLVLTSAADFVLRIASGLISVLQRTGLIAPIVGGILGYLTLMGATKFITWLKSGALVNWIKSATTATASFGKNLLSVLGTTQAMAIGIGALVGSIAYFVQNLDKMGSTAKWLIPVLALLAATITGIAIAKAAAAAGIAAPAQAIITGAALAGAITMAAGTAIAVGAKKYAKGASDIDGGSLFIAGEAGKTEMVYSGENGKANVANVQQMYQAEYMAVLQALKDYGAARGEMPQLQPASDTGIYQAAQRGAGKAGKRFTNY